MKSLRRIVLPGLLLAGLALLLALALWPQAVEVDVAMVERGSFRVTVEEEGRTRLSERYLVSAPVAGQLNRVLLEPGDRVERSQVLFTLHPLAADALDARRQAQAEAVLARAEAALRVALAQVESEESTQQLAATELERVRELAERQFVAQGALDRAEAEARSANARLRSAQFAVDVARHELDNARAALDVAGGTSSGAAFEVRSPIDGTVLSRLRQSEGPVAAGEAILIVGDLAALEVEVDVLSRDAVRLQPGMAVELDRWGGDGILRGRVLRVEPAGFTRVSALGVEEQRVWVIVAFESTPEQRAGLGDGYRVEARFILRESEDVLQVPASAVFRDGEAWASYVLRDGRVVKQGVVPGERSGLILEILDGLQPGDHVLRNPGRDMEAGMRAVASGVGR